MTRPHARPPSVPRSEVDSEAVTRTVLPTAPRTLPRRAGPIRALAADMARTKLIEVTARQAVSDRIAYTVAVVIGGLAARVLGWPGLALVVIGYGVAAYRAYRHWRAITAPNGVTP